MANIKVSSFTYKTTEDKDTIIVAISGDGKFIRDQEFSATSYTIASAEASVQSTAENFGILGPGKTDLYEIGMPAATPPSTSTATSYQYKMQRQGPRKGISVYQVSGTGEKEIYTGEWADSNTSDEALKKEAIQALTATYPGVAEMTAKTPPIPPKKSIEPPITPPPSTLPGNLKTNDPPKYIPQSKYKKAKKAKFGEFVIKKTQERYTGLYIETYDKKYLAGESPDQNGVELEKNEKTPSLGDLAGYLSTGLSLFQALQSAFKKKLSQDEVDKGIANRYLVQDNRTNKISETSQELFEQGKKEISDFKYVEVPWSIGYPSEDIEINGIKFQGSESRNKEAIQKLEEELPGVSKFITDYKYLASAPPPTLTVEQEKLQKQVIPDPQTAKTAFNKASFDSRK